MRTPQRGVLASPSPNTEPHSSSHQHSSRRSQQHSSPGSSSGGKRCVRCNHSYSGFGDTCPSCRSLGKKGVSHRCLNCLVCFTGFGDVCGDCQRQDVVSVSSFGGSSNSLSDFESDDERRKPKKEVASRLVPPPRSDAGDSNASDNGELEIMAATCAGNTPVVASLCARGANVNECNYEGASPLLCASIIGNEALVKTLIDGGADPNLADVYGTTPLQAAAFDGHATVVQRLLLAGAKVNSIDCEGYTALHFAVKNACGESGYQKVLGSLIAAKADPNIKALDGTSAAFMARSYTSSVDMLRKISEKSRVN